MVYGGENYRGKIADVALLFYDGSALSVGNNNDVDIVIRNRGSCPFQRHAWRSRLLRTGLIHHFLGRAFE